MSRRQRPRADADSSQRPVSQPSPSQQAGLTAEAGIAVDPAAPARRSGWAGGIALLIVLVCLAVGVLFALRTPDWQAPDEPAHVNYIAQLASDGTLPVIEAADWDADAIRRLTTARFAGVTDQQIGQLRYEDHQPPLYYALLVPVYWLGDGNLQALRIASLIISIGTVVLAFAIVRLLYPTRPWLALATMALVAFVPQNLAIMSSVNNDALANLVVAAILYTTLRHILRGGSVLWMALLLGIAVITKTTTYFTFALVLVAVVWQSIAMMRSGRRGSLVFRLLAIALIVLPFALLWWGRNLAVYGVPDFMGLGAHDAAVIGQLRTADYIAQVGASDYLLDAAATTFRSFWAQFGWMAVPLVDSIYLTILVLLGVAMLGSVVHLFTRRISPNEPRAQDRAIAMLALGIGLGLAQVLYYNTSFVQFQGRYLFPVLIPLLLWVMVGLQTWLRPLGRFAMPLLMLPGIALLLLDAYLIWRVIPGALGA